MPINDLATFDANPSNLPSTQVYSAPTLDISALFAEGIREAIPLDVNTVDIYPLVQDISDKVTTLVERPANIFESGSTGDEKTGTVAGKKSAEELALERERIELRRAELEDRQARAAAREQERAEKESAEFSRRYSSMLDKLEKSATEVFRNPLNLIPMLFRSKAASTAVQGLGKAASAAAHGIGNAFKRKPGSDEETTTESTTSTQESETLTSEQPEVVEGILEDDTPVDEGATLSEEPNAASDDIIAAEYTIVDEPQADSGVLALPAPLQDATSWGALANVPVLNSIFSDDIADAQVNEQFMNVAGSTEKERQAETELEANQLMVDTLSEPEDSEFVQAITGDTAAVASGTGGGSMGGALQAVATAGIMALLAPHMNQILGVVQQLVDFATGPLYTDVLQPMSAVFLQIFQGTASAVVNLINVVLPALAANVASFLNNFTLFNDSFAQYIPGIATALGVGFTTFIETSTTLLKAISGALTELFTDPVTALGKVGTAVGDMISNAILGILGPLSDELVVGMKEILPAMLGGFDDKTKDRLMSARMERVEARRASSVGVSPLAGASASDSAYSVQSMTVYAASLALAENTSTTAGGSTVNNTTNTSTVNVINSANPAFVQPGGSR